MDDTNSFYWVARRDAGVRPTVFGPFAFQSARKMREMLRRCGNAEYSLSSIFASQSREQAERVAKFFMPD